jgi:DNA-binding MarR family transcriptional regulator
MGAPFDSEALDALVHEKARLAILTYLASADEASVPFTELRDERGLSAGNLSVQLKNLAEAGYVEIEKGIADGKPYTSVSLTLQGRKALDAYLAAMDSLIGSLRSGAGKGKRK